MKLVSIRITILIFMILILGLSVLSVTSDSPIWEEEPLKVYRLGELKSTEPYLWQFWLGVAPMKAIAHSHTLPMYIMKSYPLICINVLVPPPDGDLYFFDRV